MTETGFPYLVEESLGKLWFFTLSDEQKIQYSCKEDGEWTEAVPIDEQAVKFFSVTIDSRDRIVLLAYTLSKQLIYYEWDEDQWYQRSLYRVSSRFENISTLLILSTATRIHLFYYLENSLKRAQESLVHSYLEKGRWKSDVLMHFLTDQSAVPQLILSDEEENLLCVYTKVLRNQTHCYLTRFDSKNAFWSKPAPLFQKQGKCGGFRGFTDSEGILHMVWREVTGEKSILSYKSIDTEALNFSGTDVLIWEGPDPLLYPCLFAGGGGYHCFWIRGGMGMVSHGERDSRHWEAAREIPDRKLLPYIHITKTLDGRSHAVPDLGDGYPGFAWSAGNSVAGRLGKRTDKEINPRSDGKEDGGHLITSPEANLLRDLRQLSERMDKTAARMDEYYNALYQLQDYIRQKDRSFFQIDAQIRKLSFEIEQLRPAKSSGHGRGGGFTVGSAEVSGIGIEGNHTMDADIDTDPDNNMGTGNDPDANIGILKLSGGTFEEKETAEIPVPEKPSDTKEQGRDDDEPVRTRPANIDSGNGEIQLGGVSIRVNPEEEEDGI